MTVSDLAVDGPVRGRLVALARWLQGRGGLTALLLLALAWSLLQVDWRDGVLHSGGATLLAEIAADLVRPDLSPRILERALEASWLTLVYAVAGLSLALLIGVPLGIIASGTVVEHAGRRRATVLIGRGVLAAMRSVHELVWAWLLVAAIGLSPYAAILALAVPYAGILGRIYAELLQDVPARPIEALRACGAGPGKTLLYGRLPMALPDLAGYGFYRFECALRSSAILGFVGLGGLGFQIQLALDDLRFREVGTYLLALIVLIVAIELWSSRLRRRLSP